MEYNQRDNKSSACTTNYLIDRLKVILATTTGVKAVIHRPWLEEKRLEIFGDRKYYNQAFDLLNIGRLDPVPYFIINLSDLPKPLRSELSSLDKESRNFILKQAVGRIFEDVNADLFHNSISRILKVKFEV